MSLFQCEVCGCCENTALACQGCNGYAVKFFDWSYAPEREGKRLCSACAPVNYAGGTPTEFGKWHDEFDRVFLPLGEFHTNKRGNLEHTASGSEDFRKFASQPPGAATPKGGDGA